MSSFCDVCSDIMFGSAVKPDYDIEQLKKTIQSEKEYHILCEGCGMSSLMIKSISNGEQQLVVRFLDFNLQKSDWEPYSKELIIKKFNESISVK